MSAKKKLVSFLLPIVAAANYQAAAQVSTPVTKVVDGTAYTYTSREFTSVQDAYSVILQSPTQGKSQLAEKLASAFQGTLGVKGDLGATFFHETGGFPLFNRSGYAWDNKKSQAIQTYSSSLLRNNQNLIAIFQSSAVAPQILPIEPSGNTFGTGNGNNISSKSKFTNLF